MDLQGFGVWGWDLGNFGFGRSGFRVWTGPACSSRQVLPPHFRKGLVGPWVGCQVPEALKRAFEDS